MKTEKVIIIKDRKRAGGRKRGPLPSVSGNRNVDRRRIASGFTPTFVFGGDVTRSINPSVPRPPGSPPVKGIGFPDQNDNTFPWSSPIGRSKELILIMSLDYDITDAYPTPLVPDNSWSLIENASVDVPFTSGTAKFQLYWRRWKEGDPVYFEVQDSWLRPSDIHLWGFAGGSSADNPFYAVTTSAPVASTISTPTITAENSNDLRLDFMNVRGFESWIYADGNSIGNDLDFYYFSAAVQENFQIASTPVVSIAAIAGDKEVEGVMVTDSLSYPEGPPGWQLISLMLRAEKGAYKYPIIDNPFLLPQFPVYNAPVGFPYVRKNDVQIVFGKAPSLPSVSEWKFTSLGVLNAETFYIGLRRAKEDQADLPQELKNQMQSGLGFELTLAACGKNLSTQFELVGTNSGSGLYATGTGGEAKENELIVDVVFSDLGNPLEPFGVKTWSNTSLEGVDELGYGDPAGQGFSGCKGYGTTSGSFNATQFELHQSVDWLVVTLKFKKR